MKHVEKLNKVCETNMWAGWWVSAVGQIYKMITHVLNEGQEFDKEILNGKTDGAESFSKEISVGYISWKEDY